MCIRDRSDAGFISIFVLDAVCFALMGWTVMWGLSLECQANKEPQAARQCKIYGWIFAPVALICYVLSKISGGKMCIRDSAYCFTCSFGEKVLCRKRKKVRF